MASSNEASVDIEEDALATEIVVLESIYINELFVKKDDKGRASSMEVELHPATGMDESKKYVCLTLGFSFPPNYPHEVPEITVRNPRGLGEENLRSLIEDMKKTAEERKGGDMLFELIEMAKDCLTEGNLPHCECAICLDHFEEGDNFIKTDCYHYFHWACLARCAAAFIASMSQEEATAVMHVNRNEEENVFRCPMCRVPLTCDLSDLLKETPPEEKEVEVVLSPELVQQQQERAALYHQQKAKGGIIDLEVEKNKFFVDENTVVSLNRGADAKVNIPVSEKPPDGNNTRQEKDQPENRKKDNSHKKVEDEKRQENRRAATRGSTGSKSRKCYMDDYDNLNQGYSDYDDDYTDVAENKGSGRGRRADAQFSRQRGQGRRQRGSRPSAWKTNSDFISSGQGYSDYEEEEFANGGADVECDRQGGRGNKADCQAIRGDRRGNRTYHRDRQEGYRDYRDSKNYRRDPRNYKENVRGSHGHLRDRKEGKGERREGSGNRQEDNQNRKEGLTREEEGLQDSRKDSLDNLKDFENDTKERTNECVRNDFEEDRMSPRDQLKDQNLPWKEQGRGWYRDGKKDRQEADQGPSRDRDRFGGNQERPGQQRARENRDTRPKGYRRERGDWTTDRYSPRETEAGENKDSRPREYQKNREDRKNDRDSPRETQTTRNWDTRPREYQKNREDRKIDRDSPRETQAERNWDTRPRGYQKDREDRVNNRDFHKETQEKKWHEPQYSSRENEGHTRPQNSRNNRREFRNEGRRDQWSNDNRHSTYRKQDNRSGSWRENNQQRNDKESAVEEEEWGVTCQTTHSEKHKTSPADGHSGHESDKSETIQTDTDRSWGRGDRTFARGRQSRGRWNSRGQSRPISSQSGMDTDAQSQRTDRPKKPQAKDCQSFGPKGGRPEDFTENGKENWDSKCVEQKNLSVKSEQVDKPKHAMKKEKTGTEVRNSSGEEDWGTDTQPRKQASSEHQHSAGPRSSKTGQKHSARDKPHSRHGQGHPPGLACQGPPPGFGERDSSRKPPPADIPKPAARVGPPPGFS